MQNLECIREYREKSATCEYPPVLLLFYALYGQIFFVCSIHSHSPNLWMFFPLSIYIWLIFFQPRPLKHHKQQQFVWSTLSVTREFSRFISFLHLIIFSFFFLLEVCFVITHSDEMNHLEKIENTLEKLEKCNKKITQISVRKSTDKKETHGLILCFFLFFFLSFFLNFFSNNHCRIFSIFNAIQS